MFNYTIEIALKSGSILEIWGTETERQLLFQQFSDHIQDPASTVFIGGTYASSDGDLRILASDVTGIASVKT